MQHQDLTVDVGSGANSNDRDFQIFSYLAAMYGRYLFENNTKTSYFFKQTCVFHKLFCFGFFSGTYHIGPEPVNRLRSQTQMPHYRYASTENSCYRFFNFASTF